ncbi:MAG: hypothetical protein IJ863_08725 [Spirochaetales bacterium]|nr:hypothetical protein [Spirochaetales bacterium]
MEQTDRAALRNLILGAVLGVILSRFSIGSILMTVPVLLACRGVRRDGIKAGVFGAMLLAVTVWSLVSYRELIGTEYWPVMLTGLYVPVAMIAGSAVWALTYGRSGSLMRRFFWACIPVFAMGLLMSLYFAIDESQGVRDIMVNSVLYYVRSDTLGVDFEPIVRMVVDSLMYYFAPMGVLLLAFPIVVSDVNLNRFDEQWQYDFANMKLPDTYVWVLFGSLALSLLSVWLKAFPVWLKALSWNLALSMMVLYFVVGVSILVAFARRRTAAITAGRIVFTVCLFCFIPGLNVVAVFGLPVLGILETWIHFR